MLTMEERAFFIRLIRRSLEDAAQAATAKGPRAPGNAPRRPAAKDPPRTSSPADAADKTPCA